jgi:hypothetical protein
MASHTRTVVKTLVTERDRYNVQKWAWAQVKHLDLPRRDRMLLAAKLELDWWGRWRKEQAKED